MKATGLSWVAKAGLPLEMREILGRHCSSVTSTACVYSRDLQGQALENLSSVLDDIAQDRFKPDEVRSMRWPVPNNPQPGTPAHFYTAHPQTPRVAPFTPVHAPPALGTPRPVMPLKIESSDSNISDDEAIIPCDSDSASSEDTDDQPEQQPNQTYALGYHYHLKSKILHKLAEQNPATFQCGAKVSSNFVAIADITDIDWVKCTRCFRDLHVSCD